MVCPDSSILLECNTPSAQCRSFFLFRQTLTLGCLQMYLQISILLLLTLLQIAENENSSHCAFLYKKYSLAYIPWLFILYYGERVSLVIITSDMLSAILCSHVYFATLMYTLARTFHSLKDTILTVVCILVCYVSLPCIRKPYVYLQKSYVQCVCLCV